MEIEWYDLLFYYLNFHQNLRSDMDLVVNSPMAAEKMDRSMSVLVTEGIDRVAIVVFVIVAKMDSDRHAVAVDQVEVFAQTLVATSMDVERQLDCLEQQ